MAFEDQDGDDRSELLTSDVVAKSAQGLRYSPMLKYKVLDQPLVLLVLPPDLQWDKKMLHQLLVGASRASVKLCEFARDATG